VGQAAGCGCGSGRLQQEVHGGDVGGDRWWWAVADHFKLDDHNVRGQEHVFRKLWLDGPAPALLNGNMARHSPAYLGLAWLGSRPEAGPGTALVPVPVLRLGLWSTPHAYSHFMTKMDIKFS
jgi:hypothetical protein